MIEHQGLILGMRLGLQNAQAVCVALPPADPLLAAVVPHEDHQRGAGLAEPSLTCEWDDYDAAGELAGAVSIKTYLRSMERGLTRCRRRALFRR